MPTTDVKSANSEQRPQKTEPNHSPLEKAVQLSWLNTEQRTFSWESKSFLQCVFVQRGQIELFLPEHGKSIIPANSWFALSLDGWTANCRITSGTRALILNCEESLWREFVTEGDQLSHAHKACITCSQRQETVFFSQPVTPLVREILNRLEAISGDRFSDRLRLHAGAVELLATVSDSNAMSGAAEPEPCLRSEDEAALEAAARYLEENLSEDHSLAQISRTVHLNEFKLKKGFKEYFQTTVFGYLRQKRMEYASRLLTQNKVTVIEAAQAVGYSNPSHFSRAFRNAFGVNPREYLLSSSYGS